MNLTDDPNQPPTFSEDAWPAAQALCSVVRALQERTVFLAADPDGQLAYVDQVLQQKRGSRR